MPEIRTSISELIREKTCRTDAQLLAYAVMPNHIHVVLRQGLAELQSVMQPLLRSLAHHVQSHHKFTGTVVERRYRDRPCETANHVREALVYTHLNPWRAALCGNDMEYPWITHGAYLPGGNPDHFGISVHAQMRVLALFLNEEHESREQLSAGYETYFRWRMRHDEHHSAVIKGTRLKQAPPQPSTSYGDSAWSHYFADDAQADSYEQSRLPDLRDFIRRQMANIGPDFRIDDFRGSWLPRRLNRMRVDMIRAATERGFRTTLIADVFDVSPPTVSRVKYDRGAD